MSSGRKLIARLAATLLVLPVLYAASIGPVLFLTYHLEHRAKLVRGSTVYGGPVYWRVYRSYALLRRVAYTTALDSPLSVYLRLWHVPLVKVTLAGKTGTAQPPPLRTPSTPATQAQQ